MTTIKLYYEAYISEENKNNVLDKLIMFDILHGLIYHKLEVLVYLFNHIS